MTLFYIVASTSVLIYYVFYRRYKPLPLTKPLITRTWPPDDRYNLRTIDSPTAYGFMAKVFDKLCASMFGYYVLVPLIMRFAETTLFKDTSISEVATFLPIVKWGKASDAGNGKKLDLWEYLKASDTSSEGFNFLTTSNLVRMYRNGETTPVNVAEAAIKGIKNSQRMSPSMCIFVEYHEKEILKMAQESTERYKNGKPLSVFDGVPVSCKDEYRVWGHTCRSGTSFLMDNIEREVEESAVVNRLRKGGAIILGTTNMHYFGMGTLGYNTSKAHGTCRNPYNPDHISGGSSSGSGASVAAGLNVVSLAVDAAGSTRIPAGVCGVVGVKATYGRISAANIIVSIDSLTHPGPIAATVRDAALAYAFLAGPDERYPPSLEQPEVSLENFEDKNLKGIRIGVDWTFFKDCSAVVLDACLKAVEYLEKECNAEIVPIVISELRESQLAVVVSALVELITNRRVELVNNYDELEYCARNFTLLGHQYSAAEFLLAQKQRTRSINILKEIFKEVDCFVTPGQASTAAKVIPGALGTGAIDTVTSTEMMKYMLIGNLTGIPCTVLPIGYSKEGLPIPLQICAPWYQEALMLRVAHAAEDLIKGQRRKPQVFYELI